MLELSFRASLASISAEMTELSACRGKNADGQTDGIDIS